MLVIHILGLREHIKRLIVRYIQHDELNDYVRRIAVKVNTFRWGA